ncbi:MULTISPECIES: type II toxin-antitoxin system RelE/ParE family toxin [Idiomarinaceae]|uniref:Type II toxin-antitoxin system RelE/ParE family toxin n=1 Tax=Pseudidiomarina fusca TaxID=2965078 RepID=A0ABU3KVC0_9GAMM|nr:MULTISPECIES: type II toxin-antitoxin system RelE/ParE family toxin [Idiomarinaceae]MDT7525122.1 type II toxin-antitoxin system RelE/ParE family toxin [Pseudidiomarina sp. GXY010]UUN15000.1 type II toxin-antitoxin system RelE/ParE family toxin [Idiomarina loihiensis]
MRDREQIYDFIENDNPVAALQLDNQVSSSVANLSEYPEIGREGRVLGTRELVVHANYIVVYDFSKDALRILRILHAAMKWP